MAVTHDSAASQLGFVQNKFEIMYRLLIYSQKLRNTSVEIPIEEWVDLELSKDI